RFFKARSNLLGLDPIRIGPTVVEAQGIKRLEASEPFLEGVRIEEVGDSLVCREREMMVALGANAEVLLDLFAEESCLATLAAHPAAFGHSFAFGVLVPGVWRSSVARWHLRPPSGRPVPQEHRGNLDQLETAARPSLVELNARLTAQVRGDHFGQRLCDHQ